MSSLIGELERKEILTAQAVADIRRYIAAKFPSMSSVERARVFADAVNRIVDRHIPDIQEVQKLRLKEQLFLDTFGKPAFRMDRSHVFMAAVKLDAGDDRYFRGMTAWLGESVGAGLDEESVANLIIRVRRLMDEVPEYSIAEALGVVEEGLLEAAGNDIGQQLPETAAPHIVQATGEAACMGHPAGDGENETGDADSPAMKQLQVIEPTQAEDCNQEERVAASQILTVQEEPASKRRKIKLRGNLGKVLVAAGFAGLVLSSLLQFDMPILSKAAETQLADNGAIHEILADSKTAEDMSESPYSDKTYFVSRDGSADAQPGWRGNRIFTATAYDLSIESCGKSPQDPGYGITATGVKAIEGRTIAVDPKVIELGTRVYLTFPEEYSHMNGMYVAEDTGRLIQGLHIDIFFGEDQKGSRDVFQRAMKFGVQQVEVEIVN